MNVIKYPKPDTWDELLKRPSLSDEGLYESVASIMQQVRQQGDEAVIDLTEKFDGIRLNTLRQEIEVPQLDPELETAIRIAFDNIQTFHEGQWEQSNPVETMEGVYCWRKSVPIQTVGLYIPGGSAPLFSSLLMLGIPAKIAGCQNIVVCTPPQKDGSIHPAIQFTASLIGIDTIHPIGGAQAVAAMTYGTDSIPRVDKIFGPGNQFVTIAKQMAQTEGVAIDMPAGPSEVLVIADARANAEFVAADLLSQAEHGPDSQVILVSDSSELIERVSDEIAKQLEALPRRNIAEQAMANSRAFLVEDLKEAYALSNAYAPEHLILATENAANETELITSAGSAFIGAYSCESMGDYASGTNHTLPTNGYARNYSGVSLDSFLKKITFQQLNEAGIRNLGPAVEKMAEAEGLQAHKNAVTVRLKSLENV